MTTNQKIHLKSKLALFHRSYLISFNLSNVGEFSGVESERTVSEFRERKGNVYVVFSYSVKRAREIRNVHVAVVQRWLNLCKKAWCTCKVVFLVNINLLLFCRSRCRRRRRCLSSLSVIQKFCYHDNVTSHFSSLLVLLLFFELLFLPLAEMP